MSKAKKAKKEAVQNDWKLIMFSFIIFLNKNLQYGSLMESNNAKALGYLN